MATWGDYAGEVGSPPAQDVDTATFFFHLPRYSGDLNTWGQWINGNFACVSFILRDAFAPSTGPAKIAWALPKAGGTVTGNIVFGAGASCGSAAAPAAELQGLAWQVRAAAGGAVTAQCTGAGAISGTDVTSTCDQRLKSNIRPADDRALFLGVAALAAKFYERNSTGKTELGLIAQEVQAHLPMCVEQLDDQMKTLTISMPKLMTAVIAAFGYAMRNPADAFASQR